MKRETCDLSWGSHGCGLPVGHPEHIHVCGVIDPCSQFDGSAQRVRFWMGDEWSAWMPGRSFR